MAARTALTLAKAESLAERVAEAFAPHCTRLDIAGSIRRRCAVVNDIDLVVLPKPGMFGVVDRIFRECLGVGGLLRDGLSHKSGLLRKSNVQLDLWIARHQTDGDMFKPGLPCNYGGQLLTYTGSPVHNMKLARRADALGMTFKAGWGVVDAEGGMHFMTEEEIFDALKLPFLDPEQR